MCGGQEEWARRLFVISVPKLNLVDISTNLQDNSVDKTKDLQSHDSSDASSFPFRLFE